MAKSLNTIGMRIDAIRQKHGLTLYRVAKNAGMDYSQFYRMMRGTGQPARESLIRICRALGCSLQEASEIFFDTNYRLPSPEELEEASQPAA